MNNFFIRVSWRITGNTIYFQKDINRVPLVTLKDKIGADASDKIAFRWQIIFFVAILLSVLSFAWRAHKCQHEICYRSKIFLINGASQIVVLLRISHEVSQFSSNIYGVGTFALFYIYIYIYTHVVHT